MDENDEEFPIDISYGSIEGIGGNPGCNSKEVELENKVSELRYQVSKLTRENKDLVTFKENSDVK